jgi:phosphatidylserine decarboxylase
VKRHVGGWLPQDHGVLKDYVARLVRDIKKSAPSKGYTHPVIQQFRDLIEGDPILFMYFSEMFTQVPDKYPYTEDPDHQPAVSVGIAARAC